MTSPQRMRIVTPERLDTLVASLVNNATSSTGTAVANHAGTGTPTTTGVVTATANTLMQRDANGRSQIATPSVSADIATKGYVDTTVGGYILTSTKGAASGVASLDSTGHVPAGQIASLFPRNLGSGTAFPTGQNLGDIFTHTGVGSLFRWGGAQWEQASRCSVANRTARDALLNNYKAVLPLGFLVSQADFDWIWRLDQKGWIYAGWEGNGANTVYSATSAPSGPQFKYTRTNFSVPHNVGQTPTGWVFEAANTGDTEREIVTYTGNGAWTFHDRCAASVVLEAFSDIGSYGSSFLYLYPAGGAFVMPTGNMRDIRHRSASGYPGSGSLSQVLSWDGYVDAGSTFTTGVFQYCADGSSAVAYNLYVSITLHP